MTKLGSGTLTIDYPTYYTGNTFVNAGTLIMAATSSTTTTVASGATMGGSFQFTNLVVNAPIAGVRGTLSPGVAGTSSGAGICRAAI